VPHALSSGLPKDFVRPCLLLLLREGEAHGYELAESVSVFGFDHSDPGALYRALRRLEKDGLVTSSWQPSEAGPLRRVYALTDVGTAELDLRAADLAEGERRIDAFLDRYLRARRVSAANPRHRAVAGRIAAHRVAAQGRDAQGPR
jgi:PadR family transcriptional regulator, regulatory protein PadR